MQDLQRAINRRKFEATLRPRLDAEIEDWHASQPSTGPRTVVVESSDPGTTPLGGPISIRYEWADERETDPTA